MKHICDHDDCVQPAVTFTGRKNRQFWCTEHDRRPRPSYEGWRRLPADEQQVLMSQHLGSCVQLVDMHNLCMEPVTWMAMARTDNIRAPYRFCDLHAEIEMRVTKTGNHAQSH